jgi:hypothetical protein
MSERKYSVSEIDALRQAVRNKYIWGSYRGSQALMSVMKDGACYSDSSMMSRAFNETEMIGSTEEMVRTHMLAGHTAEDLLASEQQAA